MITTTAHDTWEEMVEFVNKEKPLQFAVVFDTEEKEWQYSRHCKFIVGPDNDPVKVSA